MWYWHRLVAFAALCASGKALTAASWRGKEVHHKNGVKTDNRGDNLQVVTSEEHHELTAKERHASGSDAWKKMGVTQGAPCEYDKGDGEGWKRAASQKEAERQTGLAAGTLSRALKNSDGAEVSFKGMQFRDVSVITTRRTSRACRATRRTATSRSSRRTSTGSSGSTTASPSARTSARRRRARLFRRRSAERL